MNNKQQICKTAQASFRYSLLASCIAMALPVHAQTAPENETGVKEKGLAEVVVTAERRKASVQKTAISIVAVTGEQLKEKAQTTIESVLREIPAVTVQNAPQGAQVYVRGVGSNGDANFIDPSVALMLDNVYSGRAEQVYGGMYDVSRVEVLRGPQGTLYGRNATGGVVNVLTNNPTDKFEGNVNAQIGNYNLRHIDGSLNIPVNEALALRVAGVSNKRDGYISNGGSGSDFTAGRIKALVKPSSTFSVLASVDYSHEQGLGSATVPRETTVPLAMAFVHGWKTDYTNPWETDEYHPADRRNYRFTTYSLQADWDLGWANLTYIPAKTHSSRWTKTNLILGIANDTATTTNMASSTYTEDQYTHELRLSSPTSSPIKWTAGLYSLKSTNLSVADTTDTSSSSSTADYEVTGNVGATTSRAIFGQITYPITDTFRVTLGARKTKDSKLSSYQVVSTISSTPGDDGYYDTGLQVMDAGYSSTTYKAGIEYDLAPSAMMYAQVGSGYKSGGFSTNSIPLTTYDPEHLTAYEIGLKSRLLDNTLQLNAEIYSYNYEGFQVQYQTWGSSPNLAISAAVSPQFLQLVANAGKGVNNGLEIEAKYKLTPNDQISVAFAYTNAHYGDFSVTDLQYLNGTKVATVAPQTVNLGYEHVFELDNGANISAKLQTKLSDGYATNVTNTLPGVIDSLYHQANFHRTDVTVTYRSADEKWTVGAWLKNIENKAQITSVMPLSRVTVSDPRTFGINLGYKF